MKHDLNDSDIERWLNEGGVQLPISTEVLDPGVLDEAERRVIACLGAAVISSWSLFPTDIRRTILQAALSASTYDASMLKQNVAGFLRGRQGPLR
ncbi:MAG: hypothetical protein ACN6O5_26695 [Achromobacter sp.]|uniref:hypothetical protein n=1 Tax=unclassified Achromobacter TaxID=2626865 RepID=UPI0009EB8EA1|nr:hypothetical protein [Achromobacter sp. Root565]